MYGHIFLNWRLSSSELQDNAQVSWNQRMHWFHGAEMEGKTISAEGQIQNKKESKLESSIGYGG